MQDVSNEVFPRIVCVAMKCGDGVADEVADRWREQGYRVRVVNRTVRADGATADLLVVVLLGKRAP
jgi:hypothetical protein